MSLTAQTEQFTDEWDEGTWLNSTLAGRYGSKTNIWGIGSLMFQACLLSLPPEPITFIHPATDQNPGNFRSYGQQLRNHIVGTAAAIGQQPVYSTTLINLIHRCLAHLVAERPTAVQLYRATRNEVRAMLNNPTANPNYREIFEEHDIGNISGPFFTP